MAATMTVEKLYEICETLDPIPDKTTEEAKTIFESILEGSKGDVNARRLTAQLIVRFFTKFPGSREKVLDTIFGLCEDDDITIRKSVIKDLPTLCKEDGPHVSKIIDVLVQLLQAEDQQENHLVQTALNSVFQSYAKIVLTTLFEHILGAEEELLRERAVKYLAARLKTANAFVLTRDLEDLVVAESKKVLLDVTGDEFVIFVGILSSLPHLQTVTGRQQLLDIVTEQADLDKPFDPQDPDRLDQIIQCVRQAIPLFSRNVPSTRYTSYLLDQVLPVLPQIKAEGDADGYRLEVLRLTSELTPNSGDLENGEKHMEMIVKMLNLLLPLPPSEEGAVAPKEEEEPQLQFSQIEALVWTLHQLGKKLNGFFQGDNNQTDLVKDFRKRLQYVARVIQVYSKKLREVLSGKPREDLLKDENKLKVIAFKTTNNIQSLVKDLLHIPPIYKAVIHPSWKAPEKPADPSNLKRESSETNGADARAKRFHKDPVTVYTPPTGKFSEKVGSFQSPTGTRGFRGVGGRGTFGRGRGRGRGSWSNRGYY